jgi:hypothetical protein
MVGTTNASEIIDWAINAGCHNDTLIAMFNAFLDDSGDPKRERYAAVGGLVASARHWGTFELAWANETYELKEPFRSTECECQKGQFSTWKKSDCDNLMKRLVDTIYEYRITGWGAVVDIGAFKAAFPNSREYDPYFTGVKFTIGILAGAADYLGEDLHLWFEESQTTQRKVALRQNPTRPPFQAAFLKATNSVLVAASR